MMGALRCGALDQSDGYLFVQKGRRTRALGFCMERRSSDDERETISRSLAVDFEDDLSPSMLRTLVP